MKTKERKELEINILMEDRCTMHEAIKHLKNGTMIWDNPEEWIQSLKDCDCYDGETIEDARAGKCANISVVEYQGREYLIEYVL